MNRHCIFPSKVLSAPTTRVWVLGAMTVLCGLLAVGPLTARAASFDVNARILCPASFLVGANPLGGNLLDPTFATAVNPPCAGIRVVAMDADFGFDEYCGAAYTDARGRVLFRGECGDTSRPSPEVYLRIEGRSLNGFSVGVVQTNVIERILDHLEDIWERFVEDGTPIPVPVLHELRPHQTFAWLTPSRRVADGASFDLGADLVVGAGGPVSIMAGRQFPAAQFATFRLRAGTRYRPMHFNYTVNAPLPPFTIAFTAYDTVVVDFTRNTPARAPAALAATAHEIGHVLYNTYHSDTLHWVGDVPDYLTNHAACDLGRHHQTLAWYEGFADFVRDYVHQQWFWPEFRWMGMPLTAATPLPPPGAPPLVTPTLPGAPPFPGSVFGVNAATGAPCPADMSDEGNVAGLLNNVFFGPVRPVLVDGLNPSAGGLTFGCPDGALPVAAPATGALECTVRLPATCATGRLVIDANGLADGCRVWVENPRCANAPPGRNTSCPYDDLEEMHSLGCAGGPAIRQGGRDACPTQVPATHSLPNGRPRPRPDGSPDMVLGTASSGGLAWFSLPSLDDVMGWVDEAGTDDHRAREYWERRIRPWCLRGDGSLRDRYCRPNRSPTFFGELTTLDPALN